MQRLNQSARHPLPERRAAAARFRTAFAASLVVCCYLSGVPAAGATAPDPLTAPDGASSSREAAEAAYRDGRHQEAFAAWGRAAAAAPHDARAWLRVGNLWQRAGDPQRAAQAYRTAMQGQPEEARARAALNLALLSLGQAGIALRSLDPQRLPIELRPLSRLLEQQLNAAQAAADAVASGASVPATVAEPSALGAP